MQLHNLPKMTAKNKKRLGQGHGSGRGKTAGRGTKGQKARGKIKLHFEGGALPLIKRMPFLKGKGKNKHLKREPVVVNLGKFKDFPAKTIVDLDFLIKQRLVKEEEGKVFGVKILGDGELKISLTVKLPVSKGAKKKIEKAGGSVEV